jgi:hypothetical protein
MLGASTARQIRELIAVKNIRSLENGPLGGTLLHFGNDVIGQAVHEAPEPSAMLSISGALVALLIAHRIRLGGNRTSV